MNPSPPELFPQRPVRSDFSRAPSYRARRIMTVTVLVILVLGSIRLIFGNPFSHSGEIATIKAEGAWKQRPDQPGGVDIPHQDVQVYQALDAKDNAKPPVEHLLPPPETPLPAPSISAANVNTAILPPTVDPSAPEIENLAPPKLDIDNVTTTVTSQVVSAPEASPPSMAPPPASAPVAAIEAVPSSVPSIPASLPPVSNASATRVQIPAHVAKPKPSLTIAQVLKDTESTLKTDRIVQLASVQDQAFAGAMAEKLQSQYTSILGTAQLHVVQANVVGKGTYYRIQSQPVSGDQASDICAALHKMKAGCILVRP